MYQPTEQELLEMGFAINKISPINSNFSAWTTIGSLGLDYDYPGKWTLFDSSEQTPLYPQSKQDIVTLIRLFSKP